VIKKKKKTHQFNFQGRGAETRNASGESLNDWIEEVKKCREDLLKNETWRESDICIILANATSKDSIKYWKFYLMLKSR
jgi:hypothetical protein